MGTSPIALLRDAWDAKDQEERCQRHSPLRHHPVRAGAMLRLEMSKFTMGMGR